VLPKSVSLLLLTIYIKKKVVTNEDQKTLAFAPSALAFVPSDSPARAPPPMSDDDYDEEKEEEVARMWEAVRGGDQVLIYELLVGDGDDPPCGLTVDCKDGNGMTPLHWLTVEGHTAVTQWFIDEVGAAVDEADTRYGQTALHFAATKGKATAAGLLLNRGADPVRRDTAGWTPLHAAARSGSADVGATLIAALKPEQIDLSGPNGCTALHRAVYWGHYEVLSVPARPLCVLLLPAACRPLPRSRATPVFFACMLMFWLPGSAFCAGGGTACGGRGGQIQGRRVGPFADGDGVRWRRALRDAAQAAEVATTQRAYL